jgi:RNA polymerase sigma-70 factor (ECF subfamily)
MTRKQKARPLPGRSDAAVAAFRDYAPELHRYIARQMRQPQNAADLTQEIFARFLQVPDPGTVRNAQAFLYGIASNLVRELRHREAHNLIFYDSDSVERAGAEEVADRLALQQDLRRALAKLPPAHRAVLLLVKRDGLTYEEVSQQTGLAVTTVANYVSEARARIKMVLKE